MPIFSEMHRGKFYISVIKQFFDRLTASVLLILLSPLLLIIGLILALHFLKTPIFIHKRVGKGERIFSLFKFRTMKTDFDESSITSLGKFMRSISVDELPQLLNVIKGDMSFVGPRPLLIEYLDFYNTEEKKRHEVLPGITGWAQVNGRNAIDWEKRMSLDIEYVDNISFGWDIKILGKTIMALLRRDMTSYQKGKTIKFSDYASKR
ncbi:sugar transferase [Ekhidna sp.]|uniref:sugar transferase n=1 Tax=Ekhidna sp. TaxID=2608089 RepID=UPI0032ECB486